MNAEATWYASYDERGRPPKCSRLTRLPYRDQLGMAFDLAIDFAEGRAGYRSIGRISATGETYWWWPRAQRKHGDWWMLPERTVRLMRRATDWCQRRSGSPEAQMVRLRRLQPRSHRAAARMQTEAPPWSPTSARTRRLREAIRIHPDSDAMRQLRWRRAELQEVR